MSRAAAPSKSPSSAGPSAAKKRVLLLHGWGQTRESFYGSTRPLQKKLKDFTLHYVNAPFTVTRPSAAPSESAAEAAPYPSSESAEAAAAAPQLGSAWFYYKADNPSDFSGVLGSERAPFLGLHQTLGMFMDLFAKEGPFDAIIGFSQGAEMASLLCAHAAKFRDRTADAEAKAPPPSLPYSEQTAEEISARLHSGPSPFGSLRCAVFISGLMFPMPTNAEISDWYDSKDRLDFPSLHVYASQDPFVGKDNTLAMMAVYKDPEQYEHDRKHIVPQRAEDLAKITAFLAKHL